MTTDPFFDSADDDQEALVISIDAFEGPLDLLLHLVRQRRVEIEQVSILAVVDQYIAWVRSAQSFRLELAADWLVMMANLAYLKSKILLPAPKDEKAAASAVVEDLAVRLRRLDALRSIGEALMFRPRLGVDWFASPALDAAKGPGKRLDASLHAILSAYVREARYTLQPAQAPVRKPHVTLSVEEAIAALGDSWIPDDRFASILTFVDRETSVDIIHARSKIASTYVAALELAKRGKVEVQQQDLAIGIKSTGGAR